MKLARTLGMVSWMLEVGAPKVEPYRDTISHCSPGWRSILELAKTEALTGVAKPTRDLAISDGLHDLDLRWGETVSADVDSLDQERGTLAIVGKGKTDAKKRTLPDPTRGALSRWLEIRTSKPRPVARSEGGFGDSVAGESNDNNVTRLGAGISEGDIPVANSRSIDLANTRRSINGMLRALRSWTKPGHGVRSTSARGE